MRSFMEIPLDRIQTVNNYDDETRWLAGSEAMRRGFKYRLYINWYSSTDIRPIPTYLRPLIKTINYGSSVYEADNSIIWIQCFSDGEIRSAIYGRSPEYTRETEQLIRQWFPEVTSASDGLPVIFWGYGPYGPQSFRRVLETSSLSEMLGNYTESVKGALQELSTLIADQQVSGKLILWTGDPGTGKSWALRGLARDWRDWCDLHYILDPEHLFGEHADYLIRILLGDENQNKWRLVVLEDTGELLSRDAKTRSGQGFSRLLNVCDGLIGQGLKTLVLITTNEELSGIHSAVTRSGRCLANIHFAPLTEREARQWIADAGLSPSVEIPDPATLANLYALSSGMHLEMRNIPLFKK